MAALIADRGKFPPEFYFGSRPFLHDRLMVTTLAGFVPLTVD
jgi:hypothetical protein